MPEDKKPIGLITHYFTGIGVAIVKLDAPIKTGDHISIEGATTKFKQRVISMQIDGKNVTNAKKGDGIGLKVDDKVRKGDKVYPVKEK